MEYVLIQKTGFKELYLNELKKLELFPSSELVKLYNKQVDIGIVGVYRQAVFLAALRKLFIERFNQSPIKVRENILVSLTGKVREQGGGLCYVNGEPLKQERHGK